MPTNKMKRKGAEYENNQETVEHDVQNESDESMCSNEQSSESGHSSDNEELDENETVDVDFEFFDPKEIDFHGIKSLIGQTFSSDAELVALSDVSNVIIGQPQIGTCVKVNEGGEDDPFALMTVLNLNFHSEKPWCTQLKAYLLGRLESQPLIKEKLQSILQLSTINVGWLINERLINMPPQIVTPMLRMLLEELTWAEEDKEPFKFEYLLVISKIYNESESTEADESDEEGKKRPKKKKKQVNDCFYFQPEDEILAKHAEFTANYDIKNKVSVSDSRRAFQKTGIEPFRRLLVIKRSKLPLIIQEITTFIQ